MTEKNYWINFKEISYMYIHEFWGYRVIEETAYKNSNE